MLQLKSQPFVMNLLAQHSNICFWYKCKKNIKCISKWAKVFPSRRTICWSLLLRSEQLLQCVFLFDSTVWLHSASCYSPVNSRKTKYLGVCVISHRNSLQWNLMLFWSDKTIQCCHVGDFIYWKHISLSLTVRGKCLLTAVHSWDFTDSRYELSKSVDFHRIAALRIFDITFSLKPDRTDTIAVRLTMTSSVFPNDTSVLEKNFPLTARCTRSLNTLGYHSCEDVIEANPSSCRIHRPPNT